MRAESRSSCLEAGWVRVSVIWNIKPNSRLSALEETRHNQGLGRGLRDARSSSGRIRAGACRRPCADKLSCHDYLDNDDDGLWSGRYGDLYEHNFANNDDHHEHDCDQNIDELQPNNDGDHKHNHDRDCNIDKLQSDNDRDNHDVQRYGDRNQDRDSDRYFDNVQSDHDENSDEFNDEEHNGYGCFHKDFRHDHRSDYCLDHGLGHGNHNWYNRDGDSDRDVVHDNNRHHYNCLHCDRG